MNDVDVKNRKKILISPKSPKKIQKINKRNKLIKES